MNKIIEKIAMIILNLKIQKFIIFLVTMLFSSNVFAEEKIEIGVFIDNMTFDFYGDYVEEGKNFLIMSYKHETSAKNKKTELTDKELKALLWFSGKVCEGSTVSQFIAVLKYENPKKKYEAVRIDIKWGNDIAGDPNVEGRILSRKYLIDGEHCNPKLKYQN